MSTEAALLSAIAADPADDTPRLVYADFLDERGSEADSERAQFIRGQVELAHPPRRGEAARRKELAGVVKRLHRQFGTRWAAPVFDAVGTPSKPFWRETTLKSWDRGFLAWFIFESVSAFQERHNAVAAINPITMLGVRRFKDADVMALLGMPAIRTVTQLHLFGSGWGEDANAIGDDAARAIAECPYLGRLRELDLTQNRLTTAGVRAVAFSERLSGLQALRLYGNEVNDDTYRMLVTSPLAGRMAEWDVTGTSGVTSAAARTIAEATTLTHVTHLSFSNTDIRDDGVEALATAEHLAGVQSLDFRNTNITHRAVRAITRSPVFADLRELSFVKTWINGFGARFLRHSPYLKRIRDIALYDAVPERSQKALKERFGRKVDFTRR